MRIKVADRGPSSEPTEPWSEIVPRLFMGGHFHVDADGVEHDTIVLDEFDAVFSLVRLERHGPLDPIPHHVLEIPDGELDWEQIEAARTFASEATKAFTGGGRVLIRCRFGFNRSGMILAQVLVNSGYELEDAVALIRAGRSVHALNNAHFVQYLEEGL